MQRLQKIQLNNLKKWYMAAAKKENAKETYAILKEEYLSLKALLNVIGVNVIDIDIMKE